VSEAFDPPSQFDLVERLLVTMRSATEGGLMPGADGRKVRREGGREGGRTRLQGSIYNELSPTAPSLPPSLPFPENNEPPTS